MRFLPYPQSTSVPNIIVDGPPNAGTLLALSHWTKSGTPQALRADTSTGIVFRYLDEPRFRVEADAVSNNHFDEDGLLGMYALLNPSEGARYRDLLIDTASAGDFHVYRTRSAARIAMVLGALSDAAASLLPASIFHLPWPEQTAALYVQVLEMLPALLADPARFKAYWESEDNRLTDHESLIERGLITIEERPDLDLAIVRAPADLGPCHRMAIHSRTERTRIAIVQGRRFEFYYRYETWVQMASRRPMLRVDLSGLADELTLEEVPPGRWTFDDVEDLVPRLRLENGEPTLDPEAVLAQLEEHLRSGTVAWDPYDH